MPGRILVTGATGKVGSHLIKLLLNKGESIRAAARNPVAASRSLNGVSDMAEFDYMQPETFAPALKGIKKVFLVARPGDNNSDKAAAPFIDEMINSGVEHVVNLTAMGVETDNSFMLRKLEKYIEDSGIGFTHLRPNWFMQNFISGSMFNDIQAHDALHLPAADASISFIDIRDIASCAAEILTGSAHKGKSYTLTGLEALTHFDVIEKINNASGRNISYVPISEDTAISILEKGGIEIEQIERWRDFFRKVREGFCSAVTEDVEAITGMPPISFDTFAEDNADCWRKN